MDSIKELADSPPFEVSWEQEPITFPLADFDPLSDVRKEWAGVILGEDLKERALRFSWLSCNWSSLPARPEIYGEFNLPHLYFALTREPPQHNDLATEAERSLFAELRTIDSAPIRATGESAFIRIEPQKNPLEIWYQDRYLFDEVHCTQGVRRMNLDYCAYLDALLMTKGAFGWHLLFVDVSLQGDAFRPHVENLQRMLETFPALFPQHDYAGLRARLEERL
ncbi:hypothetical protein ACFXPZ_24580 [Streptomyces sp. NPDC059101]|uniref:hypothetical protein n=1 Tax=Streptomyces sp. NPDC059101 TaxID=3346728 RepID=UPI0036CAD16F